MPSLALRGWSHRRQLGPCLSPASARPQSPLPGRQYARRRPPLALALLQGDRLRASLGKAPGQPLPTLGGALLWLQENFAGAARPPGQRPGGPGAGLYRLLRFLGGALPREPSPSDPAELARAAERATPADRAAAEGELLPPGALPPTAGDAALAATLALGVAVLLRESPRHLAPAGAGGEGASAAGAAARGVAALCSALCCSATAAALALRAEPRLLLLPGRGSAAALAGRLVALRAAAPGADLTRLALLSPRLLACDPPELAAWAASLRALRASLPGAAFVDELAQEDAELLLVDFSDGLASLTSLWTADQIATMEAGECALALRAMCGMPRRGTGARERGEPSVPLG